MFCFVCGCTINGTYFVLSRHSYYACCDGPDLHSYTCIPPRLPTYPLLPLLRMSLSASVIYLGSAETHFEIDTLQDGTFDAALISPCALKHFRLAFASYQ